MYNKCLKEGIFMTDLERKYYTEFFNTHCTFCKRKIKEEEEKKKDLYVDYYRFTKMCAKLVNELGIPYNSISASYIIALLIRDGCFSVDNKFVNNTDVSDGVWEKTGFYVVNGAGCCRHIADFANDIYSELGINSIPFSCYAGNDIPKSILDVSNHLANLIYYEDMPYVYDLQNYSILRFISDKTAYNKNLDIKYYTFVPNYMGINYDVDVLAVDRLMNDFYNASKKSGIKEKELWEIERKTFDNFFKNLELILDFSRDTKVLKKEISSRLSSEKIRG